MARHEPQDQAGDRRIPGAGHVGNRVDGERRNAPWRIHAIRHEGALAPGVNHDVGKTQPMQLGDRRHRVGLGGQRFKLLQIGRDGEGWRRAGEFQELPPLRHGDRLDQQWHMNFLGEMAEPGEAGQRNIAIGHQHVGGRETLRPRLEIVDRHLLRGPHVVDRHGHLAGLIENRQIDAGRRRGGFDHFRVDASTAAGVADQAAVRIIADETCERCLNFEAGQVLGDVAADATSRHRDFARVRSPGNDRRSGPALDVGVGTADDDDLGHQKSVGAPPSRRRRSTKASSSSRMAGSMAGSWYSASACFHT